MSPTPSRILKSAGKAVARRFGLEIHRRIPDTSPYEQRVHLLSAMGITTVLDVGAHVGEYGLGLRSAGYNGRIVSFEPLTEPFAGLRQQVAGDPLWDCRQVAIAETVGQAEMHIAGNSWSSSLLAMDDRCVQSYPESAFVGVETVKTAPLDSVTPEFMREGDRTFLKMDVQGYELHVLRGGAATLSAVDALEAELSLVPLYEGQALIEDMIQHLRSAGLAPVAIFPLISDPANGDLLQVDSLFVRVGSRSG